MIPGSSKANPFGMIVILFGMESIPNEISIIPCGSKEIPSGICPVPWFKLRISDGMIRWNNFRQVDTK
jgi:hypothetical protein